MRRDSFALLVAGLVAGAVLAGCAATGTPPPRVAASSGQLKGDNTYCRWSVDYVSGGKVKKNSLVVTQLTSTRCEARHLRDEIYIGDATGSAKKVTAVGSSAEPLEIESEAGSCKKCWFNVNGGLTCVWWDAGC